MYDYQQYAAYLVMQGKADGTIRNYIPFYTSWLDWCATEGADPTAFDPLEVRAWSRSIHPSRSMRDLAGAAIYHACQMYGVESVSDAVMRPRAPKPQPDALSDDDAIKLERHAHLMGRAGTAVLVGLYTAARRASIAGMEWQYVGEETIKWYRPKNRDWHEVPLHPVLREHLEPRRCGQWLFPGRWGGHIAPGTMNEWVRKVGEAAGVGYVKPKQLRSTAATIINEVTGDVRAAQVFLGHTKITTTQIYTRVSEKRLRAACHALDQLAS